jgi:hypothetical protein
MPKSLARAAATMVFAALLSTALTGCGLAEVGVATAAGGASKAEELRQAKETEARLQQKIDAAYQQAAQQRNAGEAASQ